MLSNFINKMYFIFSFQDLFLYHLNISDSFLSCLQVASYMLKYFSSLTSTTVPAEFLYDCESRGYFSRETLTSFHMWRGLVFLSEYDF